MNNDTLLHRIAISMMPGSTSRIVSAVTDSTGCVAEFFEITESEAKAIKGIPTRWVSAQERFKAVEKAKSEVEFLSHSDVKAVWYTDENYPRRLHEAERQPAIVYTLGDTDLNNAPTVGIVGTRHASAYGVSFTEQLVADLSAKIPGIVTVSGLAYGIDVTAHRASLMAEIPTVAVVAHGLTKLYPAAHRDTAARMIKNGGTILTDYPHDTAALAPNFLARNRLVAALSDILVVVESGERGGAIATARLARKSGRQVAAVPGRTTDNYSRGCNTLIANGTARCIQSCDDLIHIMGWTTAVDTATRSDDKLPEDCIGSLTPDERTLLYNILTTEDCDNDTLTAISGLPASRVMTLLIGLEMRGIIASTPANRYNVLQTIDPVKLLLNR